VKAITESELCFDPLPNTWDHAFKQDEEATSQETAPALPPFIICNGRRLAVQNNLLGFLIQSSKWQERSSIWTDVICIIQHDDDEKHQQIGLMSSVYSKASWVIIWPSISDTHSKQAMPVLQAYGYLQLFTLGGDRPKIPFNDLTATVKSIMQIIQITASGFFGYRTKWC
jgi:Heterokaryon incompatibility protein (HET)